MSVCLRRRLKSWIDSCVKMQVYRVKDQYRCDKINVHIARLAVEEIMKHMIRTSKGGSLRKRSELKYIA